MQKNGTALEDRDFAIGQPWHLAERLMQEMLGRPRLERCAFHLIGQSCFFERPAHPDIADKAARGFGNPVESGEREGGHWGSPYWLRPRTNEMGQSRQLGKFRFVDR